MLADASWSSSIHCYFFLFSYWLSYLWLQVIVVKDLYGIKYQPSTPFFSFQTLTQLPSAFQVHLLMGWAPLLHSIEKMDVNIHWYCLMEEIPNNQPGMYKTL